MSRVITWARKHSVRFWEALCRRFSVPRLSDSREHGLSGLAPGSDAPAGLQGGPESQLT